jgi:hypothetical protein
VIIAFCRMIAVCTAFQQLTGTCSCCSQIQTLDCCSSSEPSDLAVWLIMLQEHVLAVL